MSPMDECRVEFVARDVLNSLRFLAIGDLFAAGLRVGNAQSWAARIDDDAVRARAFAVCSFATGKGLSAEMERFRVFTQVAV